MRARARGFSLIEVLAAFAILALGLAAVGEVLGMAARNATLVRDTTHAVTLAEAKLAEFGDAAGEEGGLRWRRSVAQAMPVSGDPQWIPYRVTVEVRWGSGRSLSLTTIRLRPAS